MALPLFIYSHSPLSCFAFAFYMPPFAYNWPWLLAWIWFLSWVLSWLVWSFWDGLVLSHLFVGWFFLFSAHLLLYRSTTYVLPAHCLYIHPPLFDRDRQGFGTTTETTRACLALCCFLHFCLCARALPPVYMPPLLLRTGQVGWLGLVLSLSFLPLPLWPSLPGRAFGAFLAFLRGMVALCARARLSWHARTAPCCTYLCSATYPKNRQGDARTRAPFRARAPARCSAPPSTHMPCAFAFAPLPAASIRGQFGQVLDLLRHTHTPAARTCPTCLALPLPLHFWHFWHFVTPGLTLFILNSLLFWRLGRERSMLCAWCCCAPRNKHLLCTRTHAHLSSMPAFVPCLLPPYLLLSLSSLACPHSTHLIHLHELHCLAPCPHLSLPLPYPYLPTTDFGSFYFV